MAGDTRIIRAVVTKDADGYTVMVWLRSDEAEVLLADRPWPPAPLARLANPHEST